MSNYVQSTNFATKDALPSGDPLKIVKGTEINTEFNNIAVAVATKADTASPTFTGTPAAPTASAGDNSTQIATTAYADAAIAAAKQALYPVGSIYINATNATNPGTLLGFGTWAAFGAGRVLLSSGALADNTFTAGQAGGSYDAIVVSHTHTATSTDSGHNHSYSPVSQLTGSGDEQLAVNSGTNKSVANTTNSSTANITTTVASAGSSATNANLQPYIVVVMWQRTA